MNLGLGLGLPFSRVAGPSFVGPLDEFEDDLTDVICPAWRLLSSYTGAAVRVRRLVGGQEEDIPYAFNGTLDLAYLADFMDGDTPQLRYVYPQKGTNKLGQATAASQPLLSTSVSQWGNQPAMVFAGNPQMMSFDSGTSPTSLLMGVHSTATEGIGRYCSDAAGNSSFFEVGTQSAFARFGNTDGQVSTLFANASLAHGLEMWYNGSSSIGRIDTAEEASAATAPLSGVVNVGAFDVGSQHIVGSIAYFVGLSAFYNSTQRAAVRAALAAKFPFAT
jgi:hypothetical protein